MGYGRRPAVAMVRAPWSHCLRRGRCSSRGKRRHDHEHREKSLTESGASHTHTHVILLCVAGWNTQCGSHDVEQTSSAIFGGTVDVPSDPETLRRHNATVRLRIRGNSEFCSGTLITPRHILTAAHCVLRFQPDGTSEVYRNKIEVVFQGQSNGQSWDARNQTGENGRCFVMPDATANLTPAPGQLNGCGSLCVAASA